MTHWFDRLAVSAAEGPRMTRRTGLERAAVAILAAGPLAALAERATAAQAGGRLAPADACGACHAGVRQSVTQAQVVCFSGGASPRRTRHPRRPIPHRHSAITLFAQVACYSVLVSSAAGDRAACQGSSACQDGNPPGSPPPPQLQPPGTDLCAPCLQVGGKCCYGSDPAAPCACIPPNRECKDFCS